MTNGRTIYKLFLLICCLLPIRASVALSAGADESVVARYTFDEGSGAVLKDVTGNGNDGKIVGAEWVEAGKGYALKFGRTGSYVDFGDNPNLKIAGDLTVAAWVKLMADPYPNSATNWHILNCEHYRHSGFTWRIGGSTGQAYYRSSQADDGFTDLFSNTKIDNNVFHHVAIVKKGNTVTSFIDGEWDAQTTTRNPAPGPVAFTLSDRSQSLEGLLDEVSLYRAALSVGDIVGLYKEGAESHGKDTSWFGKFKVTPYFRFAEAKTIMEVNFKGILPLADGDQVRVELARPRGDALDVKSLSIIPESCKSDFEFSLDKLPESDYELRVTLRNGGTTKAEERAPFHYPPLPPAVVSPREKVVAPLPPAPEPARYSIELCRGGGFLVRLKGKSYAVESTYSYPNGGENSLLATDSTDRKGEPDWSVKTEKGDAASYRVSSGGKHYTIQREIKLEPSRVLVKDTLTNISGADLGIIFSNNLNTRGQVRIKRHVIPDVTPMLFLHGKDHAVGMVALDDVYRVQLRKTVGEGTYGMGSDKFGLAKGVSYAVEWAVYPRGTADYYDFVNAVRKDERLDRQTIDGCYSISHAGRWLRETPPHDLVERAGLKYMSSGCVTKIADDPGLSIEGFEFIEHPRECESLKSNYIETRKLFPHLRVMFHVAPHLRATNKPEERYRDSLMLDKLEKHSLYDNPKGWFGDERLGQGWAYYPYYPTLENSYGKAMLESVDTMMYEIGTDGVFADGIISGFGARDTYDGFTYDRWDGHSVEIDPATKTIKRKMGSVYLLSREAVLAYVQKINGKRGRVIINEMALFPRSLYKENAFYNAETNDGDSRCAQMYLAPTVIGLAQPNKSSNELDVYNDIRAKLEWGALYAYYYWSCAFTHRMITAEMYPITVQEIHSGTIKGKERIITLHSGVYGWRGDRDLHFASRADGRGHVSPGNFLTTVDRSSVRTQLDLKENEMAVLRRIPVVLHSQSRVNVVVQKYDQQGIQLTLNGKGRAVVAVRNGDFAIKPNTRYRVSTIAVREVRSDSKGHLTFAAKLEGSLRVSVGVGQ
ncbi:MAG: LamG domain-containing protein [Armatimonadetes bacterium]|nr:LamG domain-containing protein [Armatimonadota bacterium]